MPDQGEWYAHHTAQVYLMPRGTGRSTPIRSVADVTYLQAAHDLEAARRALGISRWVFEGYSGGCMVGLLYALAYPRSLDGLICGFSVANTMRALTEAGERSTISARHPNCRGDLDAARLRTAPREPAALLSCDYAWLQARPNLWLLVQGETPLLARQVEQLTPRQKAWFEEIWTFDVSDRLAEINVPTLVVCGRNDEIVPFEHCVAIHEGIDGSELLLLENSGHDSVSEQDAGIYHETILRFIARMAD